MTGRREVVKALALVTTGCHVNGPRSIVMNNRLRAARDAIAIHVARGALPGAVMLVAEGDELHVEALGAMALGGPPMRRDTIFRIASMTKPIIAAAAMILVDEGKLRLEAPIDDFIPELAKRRVLARIDGPLDDTVPANRPILVRDVLTFTFGFGLIWGPPDAHPIQRAAEKLDLVAFGPPSPQRSPAPDEWMRRFATLPLMHQPGERWMYNTSADVLGVLVARASGRPLEAFLEERLFAPLAMKDTAFYIRPDKLERFATSYAPNPKTGALEILDPPDGQFGRPPAFPSGAAGLVSTIDDCRAFARMLMVGGGGVLSRASVTAMTRGQLTPAQKIPGSLDPDFWDAHGWGLGVCVITKSTPLAPVGAYGWDGGFGTSWYSDPSRGRIAILMTQRSEYPMAAAWYREFWTAIAHT